MFTGDDRPVEVQIHRTVAYLELPNEKGEYRIERFMLPKITQEQVRLFDRTGKIAKGGYLLDVPTSGRTIAYRERYFDDVRNGKREVKPHRATLLGTNKKINKKGSMSYYRNGQGKVHFRPIEVSGNE